jgi:transcriptional regulator with XRE-family HTH domain
MRKRDPLFSAFGQSVRRHREAKDMTQEDLADKAGLDRTYISDVERGSRNLSITSMSRIAKALGTTISGLTKGIDP